MLVPNGGWVAKAEEKKYQSSLSTQVRKEMVQSVKCLPLKHSLGPQEQ